MVKISKEDAEFLRQHIDGVDEIIKSGSPNDLLDVIYDIIIYKGFDDEDCYNDFGKKMQIIYDKVLYDEY